MTVVVGSAKDSLARLIDAGEAPFDFIFIDADKDNNPVYLDAALKLSRPGTVIVVDNVVRGGRVADPDNHEPDVVGVRDGSRVSWPHRIHDDRRANGRAEGLGRVLDLDRRRVTWCVSAGWLPHRPVDTGVATDRRTGRCMCRGWRYRRA